MSAIRIIRRGDNRFGAVWPLRSLTAIWAPTSRLADHTAVAGRVQGDEVMFSHNVRKCLGGVAGALAALSSALFGAAVASADNPPDPHIPNMQTGYCPGGGMGSQISLAYCDGVPYPDGSYWHIIQYGAPMIGHPYGLLSPGMQCVINPDNGPVPQPAPPGGCGGAVS
jgi:hypothetical protein